MFLSDAPVGASFKVVQVLLAREVGKRLADMGFTEGAEGLVVRAGFMHGPLQVQIRGYDILIRCCEAAGIEIQPEGLWPVSGAGSWIRGRSGRHRFGAGIASGKGQGLEHGKDRGKGRGKGHGRGPVSGLGRGA